MAKVNEAKFRTNDKGELIPLYQEADASVRNMTRPRGEVVADAGIEESAPLGPGWVKTPVPRSTECSQAAAFRRMGFSEAESELAVNEEKRRKSINDAGEALRTLVGLAN